MAWKAERQARAQPDVLGCAIQFCLSIKCLFGQPLRQALGMVESLLRLAKLDWAEPDFSTVCRRQKSLQVDLSYRPNRSALQLLVDSTGIKFLGEGEWKRKKHGAEYRREWRKVHLGIDAKTLEIRAIEVTSNAIGDAPMLPELLGQIPAEEPIESVCADGAYDTRGCLDDIAERHATAGPPRARTPRIGRRSVQDLNNAMSPSVRTSASGPSICKKEVERVPPTQPCGDEDALLQALGRTGDRAHLRPPVCGTACPRGPAQSLQPDRPSSNSAGDCCGISPSGEGGMPSETRFVQQSPWKADSWTQDV